MLKVQAGIQYGFVRSCYAAIVGLPLFTRLWSNMQKAESCLIFNACMLAKVSLRNIILFFSPSPWELRKCFCLIWVRSNLWNCSYSNKVAEPERYLETWFNKAILLSHMSIYSITVWSMCSITVFRTHSSDKAQNGGWLKCDYMC